MYREDQGYTLIMPYTKFGTLYVEIHYQGHTLFNKKVSLDLCLNHAI